MKLKELVLFPTNKSIYIRATLDLPNVGDVNIKDFLSREEIIDICQKIETKAIAHFKASIES